MDLSQLQALPAAHRTAESLKIRESQSKGRLGPVLVGIHEAPKDIQSSILERITLKQVVLYY
jgi:hypothetical protein